MKTEARPVCLKTSEYWSCSESSSSFKNSSSDLWSFLKFYKVSSYYFILDILHLRLLCFVCFVFFATKSMILYIFQNNNDVQVHVRLIVSSFVIFHTRFKTWPVTVILGLRTLHLVQVKWTYFKAYFYHHLEVFDTQHCLKQKYVECFIVS